MEPHGENKQQRYICKDCNLYFTRAPKHIHKVYICEQCYQILRRIK